MVNLKIDDSVVATVEWTNVEKDISKVIQIGNHNT